MGGAGEGAGRGGGGGQWGGRYSLDDWRVEAVEAAVQPDALRERGREERSEVEGLSHEAQTHLPQTSSSTAARGYIQVPGVERRSLRPWFQSQDSLLKSSPPFPNLNV